MGGSRPWDGEALAGRFWSGVRAWAWTLGQDLVRRGARVGGREVVLGFAPTEGGSGRVLAIVSVSGAARRFRGFVGRWLEDHGGVARSVGLDGEPALPVSWRPGQSPVAVATWMTANRSE